MENSRNPRILYLRTFREDGLNLNDAVRMITYCVLFGHIVIIGTSEEHKKLLMALSKIFSKLDEVKKSFYFIESTNNDWRQEVIRQILLADAVIFQLRPKTNTFPVVGPKFKYDLNFDHFEFYKTPLSETRTGKGLLTEISYLARLRSVEKTILFLHEDDGSELEQYIDLAYAAQAGDVFFAKKGFALPRVSLLDQQLVHLRKVGGEIRYEFEDQLDDIYRIAKVLKKFVYRILDSYKQEFIPEEALHFGIANHPKPVFPDYTLKIIEFTPVEELISIPNGYLVEVSKDAVSKFLKESIDEAKCPICLGNANQIFFYSHSIENVTLESISGRCQSCGRHVQLHASGVIDG